MKLKNDEFVPDEITVVKDGMYAGKMIKSRYFSGFKNKWITRIYLEGKVYGPRVVVALALEHVNMVREALAIGEGKLPKLPKGVRGDAQHCVLANALSNGWDASVGEDFIKLTHPNDGTVDRASVKEALDQLGFKYVVASGRTKTISIKFKTTSAMSQLISYFDEGKLRFLIDRPAEKSVSN